MTFAAIGTAAATTAISVGGAYAANKLTEGGNGGGGIGGFDLQKILDFDFETPELLTKTQDTLSNFGTDILGGDIPDYFSMLGDVGGKEFEDLLGLTRSSITTGVNEQLAKSGGSRAGAGAQIIAENIADAETKARAVNFESAKAGRTNLLGVGTNVLGNVSSTQSNLANMMNQFSLNKAKLELGAYGLAKGTADSEGGFMSDIVGSIGGIVGGGDKGGFDVASLFSGGDKSFKTTGFGTVNPSTGMSSKLGYLHF